MRLAIMRLSISVVAACLLSPSSRAWALDIVKNGAPVATVVTADGKVKERGRFATNDAEAAKVLLDWIEKITDVRLPVVAEAPKGKPAIYIGAEAVKAGLKLDDIDSASNEGSRVVVKGNRALIGGQDGRATVKAACRFLEELGCRYYMDTSYLARSGASPFKELGEQLGQIYPRTKNLSVKDYTITEKPAWVGRHAWGSCWYRTNLWKVWNGNSLDKMAVSHAWARYVSAKEYYGEHPEYFALLEGQRKRGEWLCTSNQAVRDIFVSKILAAAEQKGGQGSFSLSPPDNHEYCQCAKCRAQDDPDHIVPSSGFVSVTERFMDFFNEIGWKVYRKYPDVKLNFYAYADYTEPPTKWEQKTAPNLVVWIAPIRYSRYHHIGNPNSPSRMQMKKVVDGWSEVIGKMGYRTYNFNLAESTVPFSKIGTWKHDFRYLADRGCVGVNLETFPAWSIMSPHLWLSVRMMYDPYMAVDAAMDKYFLEFYGPQAGPLMKDYWMSIDNAFQNLKAETGCYYSLHLVYTKELLKKLRALLNRADTATRGHKIHNARVLFAQKGFRMAEDYVAYREYLNRGEFAKAREHTDRMWERAQDQFAFHNKTIEYVRRFLKKGPDSAVRFTAEPNKLHQMLPDEWRLKYDPKLEGVRQGYHKPGFDDSQWLKVKTYTATLNQQGVPEQFTWMWYRTEIEVPKKHGNLILLFLDLDGNLYPGHSKLFVDGQEVPFTPNRVRRDREGKVVTEYYKNRRPIPAKVNDVVKPGRNTVALLLDHHDITENFLGGIVRPVLLCEDNPQPEQ